MINLVRVDSELETHEEGGGCPAWNYDEIDVEG
jgi:hypothetical protein